MIDVPVLSTAEHIMHVLVESDVFTPRELEKLTSDLQSLLLKQQWLVTFSGTLFEVVTPTIGDGEHAEGMSGKDGHYWASKKFTNCLDGRGIYASSTVVSFRTIVCPRLREIVVCVRLRSHHLLVRAETVS